MVNSLRIAPALLLALSLSAALGGCGNTGDLFLPPPPVAQVPEQLPNAVPAPATEPAAPADAGATESTAP
jgi:predicted small lipoprotein YifL